MTVIALDRQFLTDYQSKLGPKSRERTCIEKLLKHINTMELAEEQKVNRECVKALEEALVGGGNG